VQPDSGEIELAGQHVRFASPAAANAAGIVCIFQELSLMPDLSVADNISASAPPKWLGMIDQKKQRQRAEELLARIGCEDVNPLMRVRDLPLSRRQMVEIAKALGKSPKVLILDEATSALTHADVQTIYRVLAELKAQGLSILYISHRMNEIDALCDRLSVFRNGKHISTFDKGAYSPDEIVEMMIGREITSQFPEKVTRPKPQPHLSVRGLSWEKRLNGIDLDLGKGEIVGLGGLDGQGQKELLLSLFGVLNGVSGSVSLGGATVAIRSPSDAKSNGRNIALIPEDRKTEGLMLPMSIANNLVAASFQKITTAGFIDAAKEHAAVEDAIKRLQIKIGTADDAVSTLSGGNQQKVVIAKWLMTKPDVILLNDPTRGIDVGTKQEIYRLLRELAAQGAAILLYSTDYEELIGCCDRVAVMYDGKIVRELEGNAINEKNIVSASLNIDQERSAA
jgi:ribose transport system ATP-binding protein